MARSLPAPIVFARVTDEPKLHRRVLAQSADPTLRRRRARPTIAGMSDHDHDHRSLLARIVTLEDIEAIRALKARYAEGADRCIGAPTAGHAAALADLFTEDASAEYGPFGRFEGRDQLIRAFHEVIPGAAVWSRHYFTNPTIEVHGNQATGHYYFLVAAVMRGAPGPINMWGTYEDRYVKTVKGWRLSSLIADFVEPPR